MKLALGTVQFGLDYGVTNLDGKTSVSDAIEILEIASNHGVDLLDTAPDYGTSETVVGEAIKSLPAMQVMTKIRSLVGRKKGQSISDWVESSFSSSCQRLSRETVHCLMVHKSTDLTGPNGPAIMEHLTFLKEQGRVERIGISAYDFLETENILREYPIDLVQMPFNVLDQRLISNGALDFFEQSKIELHVRSGFLQGVLLMDPSELPDFLLPLAPTLRSYHQQLSLSGTSLLAGALAFVRQQSAISRLVAGVTSVAEIRSLLSAFEQSKQCDIDFSQFSVSDETLISPGKWPNAWPPQNLARKKSND
jgi:aryl-alcohol dehydrogenase-like predicted oxidoreductase